MLACVYHDQLRIEDGRYVCPKRNRPCPKDFKYCKSYTPTGMLARKDIWKPDANKKLTFVFEPVVEFNGVRYTISFKTCVKYDPVLEARKKSIRKSIESAVKKNYSLADNKRIRIFDCAVKTFMRRKLMLYVNKKIKGDAHEKQGNIESESR